MREKIDNIIPSFLLDSKFRIYRHLFFFLIILVITVNIAFHIPGEIESHYLFLGWLIYFLIINGGIYINVYFLAPRLLLKNRLFYYFLSVAVVIVISIILNGILFNIGREKRLFGASSKINVKLANSTVPIVERFWNLIVYFLRKLAIRMPIAVVHNTQTNIGHSSISAETARSFCKIISSIIVLSVKFIV